MKMMKKILTAALVLAILGGGLGAAMDAVKVRGCKPGLFPKSNDVAGDFWNQRHQRFNGTAVAAVRG